MNTNKPNAKQAPPTCPQINPQGAQDSPDNTNAPEEKARAENVPTKAHRRESSQETRAAQMNRRHHQTALAAQKKALDALANIAPEDIRANEARQLLKTAQEIERRILKAEHDPDEQRAAVNALFVKVWENAQKSGG